MISPTGDKAVMLVIRADATPYTGAGHAMRCLNLAEAWKNLEAGPCVFVGETAIDFVVERLRRLEIPAYGARELPTRGVLVVDSYDNEVRHSMPSHAEYKRRVLVDDIGGPIPPAYDTVWNPNPYGDRTLYPDFDGLVLTGSTAVPVRAGLAPWRNTGSRTVGVVLGGGAIAPCLRAVFDAVAECLPEWRFAGAGDWVPSDWERISTLDPWSGLAECDRMILAGGSMTWEAAHTGIPTVLVQTADNQQLVVNWANDRSVPTIDLRSVGSIAAAAEELKDALECARALPYITNGSDHVARLLNQTAG